MTKKKLFFLGLITLLVFPILAFIIQRLFSSSSFNAIFLSETPLVYQIIIGTLTGCTIAIFGWEIMKVKYIESELTKYTQLFTKEVLTYPLIVFVSLSAGIGEEIFFRGVVQPFFGIVITSIVFVAIHGYLNPKNLKISIYGCYMVVAICVVGYLSKKVGLVTAITAHVFIDIILLIKTKNRLTKEN
jgi:hypothetical protein